MLATIEKVRISEAVARYLPDVQETSTAQSLEEAREIVGRKICPHRLEIVGGGGARLMCITSALSLGDCALSYVQYGHDVLIQSGVISEHLLIKSTLGGQGRVTCGDQTVVSTARSIIMTSMNAPTEIQMTASCRHLTARVARGTLEARIAEKLGKRLTAPLRFDLELSSQSDFGRAWHQLLVHLCNLSASAPAVLASEDVRRQYSRTMIEMLVHSAPHNYRAALDAVATQAVAWHARRARDYVHENIAEIRSVAELATSIGVTPRTLQTGFRRAFNMTPAAYIRRTRIQALHQALLGSDGKKSITELMQGVGIMHFSRYAQYYRQQIGEAPSITLRCKL